MSLKDTLQDCYAYQFSVRVQAVGFDRIFAEEYMRDKISAVSLAEAHPDFLFFEDWSLLVIDSKKSSFQILKKETIYHMLVDLYPFDQANVTQVHDFELETNH